MKLNSKIKLALAGVVVTVAVPVLPLGCMRTCVNFGCCVAVLLETITPSSILLLWLRLSKLVGSVLISKLFVVVVEGTDAVAALFDGTLFDVGELLSAAAAAAAFCSCFLACSSSCCSRLRFFAAA
uniref:Uncharacterized protein n=1 Tax=Glossina palpalis gambiensis TaxID=67801 RepID=A0A1B0BEG2_9MUSC